jgi:hypothetical protein
MMWLPTVMWLPPMMEMPNGILLRGQVSANKYHPWHCSLTIYCSADALVKSGLNPTENEGAGGHEGQTRRGEVFLLAVVTVNSNIGLVLRQLQAGVFCLFK